MREARFRAWDKENEIMYEDVAIVDNFAYRRGYVGNIFSENANAGIKMQYIGIEDAQGDEMCEGDIITFIFDGSIKTSEVKVNILKGTTVSFKSFDRVYEFNLNEIYSTDREFKIIGNIFENKDLLGD